MKTRFSPSAPVVVLVLMLLGFCAALVAGHHIRRELVYDQCVCGVIECGLERVDTRSPVKCLSEQYGRGLNDALETWMLLDLELSMTGERKTNGERANIVRQRHGMEAKR